MMRGTGMAGVLLALAGCATLGPTPPGRFDGPLVVLWVAPGTQDPAGDGRFILVPMPDEPFTFTRTAPGATVTRIVPGPIYTDGGSIPRLAQAFQGFNPWGYAPAYMIHDWLFVARHCVTDGQAQGREGEIAAMPFAESARIVGEAIATLEAEHRIGGDDIAGEAIPLVVAGPVSRARWRAKGECAGHRLTPQHAEAVRRIQRGAAPRVLRGGPDAAPLPEARVVARFSF